MNSNISYFPQNLGAVSEEQKKVFYQDIKEMELMYQGRWKVNMMAGYFWMLHREEPEAAHKRKSSERSFERGKRRFITMIYDFWVARPYNKQ